MKKLLVLIFAVMSFVIVQKAHALECIPQAAEINYLNADYVFKGSVKRVQSLGGAVLKERAVNRLVVQDQYKGDLDSEIDVYSNTTWGNIFEEGKEYLVYANQNNGEIRSNPCSGTSYMEYAQTQIEKIMNFLGFLGNPEGDYKGQFESGLSPEGTISFDIMSKGADQFVYQEYDSQDQVAKTESYANGARNGLTKIYMGEIYKQSAEFTYLDGAFNGPFKTFYPSGQINQEGNYQNGIIQGTWKAYHRNGRLKRVDQYDSGRVTASTTYDENGNLLEEKTY